MHRWGTEWPTGATGFEIDLAHFGARGDFARFRARARAFLLQHENDIAIHRLRSNQPLTATDIGELERMLIENGVGDADDLERARKESPASGYSCALSPAWSALPP